VLFIDEIHRLPAVVEEYLYPAMEDYKVDVTIDAGMHARTITMPLPRVHADRRDDRIGLLTGPMRSRFGLVNHIEFYSPDALHEILRPTRSSSRWMRRTTRCGNWRTARAARRASPTGCCGACATTPPSKARASRPCR
jgi:Holliday junction DNA helicase RuvB